MTVYLTNDSDLTSVANAIRTKSGTSNSLVYPTGFVTAINNISSGGGGSSSWTDITSEFAAAQSPGSADIHFAATDGTFVYVSCAGYDYSSVAVPQEYSELCAAYGVAQDADTGGITCIFIGSGMIGQVTSEFENWYGTIIYPLASS